MVDKGEESGQKPQNQIPELVTGERVINVYTEDKVIQKIKEAKGQGWQLFPPEQLAENAREWRESLKRAVHKNPSEWLTYARELADYSPLIHVINPSFLPDLIDKGYVSPLSSREGRGRTADYEKELGLGDYVFLSYSNWRTWVNGAELYFRPSPILEKEETVVTLFDLVVVSPFGFDKAIELYRKSAFTGKDFKELLPYFLVDVYGNIKRPQERKSFHATNGYPSWFTNVTHNSFFQPEIKVKNKLDLTDDVKIDFDERYRNIDLDRGLTDEEILKIQRFFGDRVVGRGRFDSLYEISQKGKEWWK